MKKNTIHEFSSDHVISVRASHSDGKNELVPSEQTLENIRNYSKALKVEQKKDGKGFIEYIAN